jgi:type VI protein secretion system component VasK
MHACMPVTSWWSWWILLCAHVCVWVYQHVHIYACTNMERCVMSLLPCAAYVACSVHEREEREKERKRARERERESERELGAARICEN